FQDELIIDGFEILLEVAITDGTPGIAPAKYLNTDAAAGVEIKAPRGQCVEPVRTARVKRQGAVRPHEAAVMGGIAVSSRGEGVLTAGIITVTTGCAIRTRCEIVFSSKDGCSVCGGVVELPAGNRGIRLHRL